VREVQRILGHADLCEQNKEWTKALYRHQQALVSLEAAVDDIVRSSAPGVLELVEHERKRIEELKLIISAARPSSEVEPDTSLKDKGQQCYLELRKSLEQLITLRGSLSTVLDRIKEERSKLDLEACRNRFKSISQLI